jgi:small subunit ribosomal protein S27e
MVKELIPRPESVFIKIKCLKCGNEQIVFERGSSIIRCTVCDEVLVEPSGGKGKIKGEKVQTLE